MATTKNTEKKVNTIAKETEVMQEMKKAVVAKEENHVGKYHRFCSNCGKEKIDNMLLHTEGYIQFEYVKAELKDLFALADVVISRAGANSICELLALKKPNLLIPLPAGSSRGDQILNAKSFEAQGYSMVIDDDDLSPDLLTEKVTELYFTRQTFIDAMSKSHQLGSVTTITNLIEETCAAKRSHK